MNTKVFMFYSYKGGSGRTVSSGNVAAALAKHGKRVMVIDMDFEAPGLHNVFDVSESDKYQNTLGIQDYLKGSVALEEVSDEMVIDMGSEKEVKGGALPIKDGGKLLYLMASPKTTPVAFNSEKPQLYAKMIDLKRYFSEEENLDYIILDSASGIREAFSLPMSISNELMIFFRWTRQHFEGTCKVLSLWKFHDDLSDGQESIKLPNVHLIASAVPKSAELDSLENKQLAKELRKLHEDNKQTLTKSFGPKGKLLFEIPELIELKWQESIIVFDKENNPYDDIAFRIMGLH